MGPSIKKEKMAGVTQPKKKLLKEKTRVVAGTSSEPNPLPCLIARGTHVVRAMLLHLRQKREPI
jgi:hypothetical protein